MLNVVLDLKMHEKEITQIALLNFMKELKTTEEVIYALTLKKLKETECKVDGMYMRCMENALNYQGKKDKDESLFSLASFIKQQRENFQYNSMKHLFIGRA